MKETRIAHLGRYATERLWQDMERLLKADNLNTAQFYAKCLRNALLPEEVSLEEVSQAKIRHLESVAHARYEEIERLETELAAAQAAGGNAAKMAALLLEIGQDERSKLWQGLREEIEAVLHADTTEEVKP